MVEYPVGLPKPLIDYGLNIANGIVRTQMDAGNARQRRRFSQTYQQATVEWVLDDSQFQLFEGFFYHLANGANDWFLMNCTITGGDTKLHTCRIVDGKLSAKRQSGRHWRVSANVDIDAMNRLDIETTYKKLRVTPPVDPNKPGVPDLATFKLTGQKTFSDRLDYSRSGAAWATDGSHLYRMGKVYPVGTPWQIASVDTDNPVSTGYASLNVMFLEGGPAVGRWVAESSPSRGKSYPRGYIYIKQLTSAYVVAGGSTMATSWSTHQKEVWFSPDGYYYYYRVAYPGHRSTRYTIYGRKLKQPFRVDGEYESAGFYGDTTVKFGDFCLSGDGSRLFVLAYSDGKTVLKQYRLKTPWHLGSPHTAAIRPVFEHKLDLEHITGSSDPSRSIFIRKDGSKLYYSTITTVYELTGQPR